MRTRTLAGFARKNVRGSPIYVRSGGQTVSLVPEVSTFEGWLGAWSYRILRPARLYVIDDKGVTAVPLQGSLIRQRTVLMLMLVVAIMMAVSLSRIAARAAVTGRIERSEG